MIEDESDAAAPPGDYSDVAVGSPATIEDIKTTNETSRREITVEEGGQSVTVKLWNEHTEISINKGQRILIRNL